MNDDRSKYIDKLESELRKSSLARKFVDTESGQYVMEYINEVVSALTNKILNSRRTEEEYIEARAQIEILRKLRQVLDVSSSDSAILSIREKLELAKSEN